MFVLPLAIYDVWALFWLTVGNMDKISNFLTESTDEIAALISIIFGVTTGCYMMITGAEFNEISVALITMFVGTPLGLLFKRNRE